jgi:putative ABC transport system ATP-binding protein
LWPYDRRPSITDDGSYRTNEVDMSRRTSGVGARGSAGATDALRWALDETRVHPGHRVGAATTVLLEGVSRSYTVGAGTVTALRDVDVEIDAGEFVVVLGPSGSGKSTLLNVVGALDAPTSGTVTVAGRVITGASRGDLAALRREVVAFVFQTFNLFPTLTALENVQCGAEITKRVGAAHRIAIETLEQVGLGDRLDHFPSELSGGEQQRVAIARALATGNPLLLADEPTGDLDFRTGVQILQLLQAQSAAGRTVIVVTHNREIARIADRVIELSSGRIASDGPPPGGKADVDSLRW